MKTDDLLASIEIGFDLEGFVEIVRCRLSKVVSYALLVKQLAISGFSKRVRNING